MNALANLRQLLGISEQDDVSCGRSHRDRVGQRDLSRLIDEEVVQERVDALARELPRGPSDERGTRRVAFFRIEGVFDQGPVEPVVPFRTLLEPFEDDPISYRQSSETRLGVGRLRMVTVGNLVATNRGVFL
jgi:hypothetical protein